MFEMVTSKNNCSEKLKMWTSKNKKIKCFLKKC